MEIDVDTFDEVMQGSKGIHIVEFGAPWCGPCKRIEPILELLTKEYGVGLTKINVDEAPGYLGKLDILSVPLILVYSDGRLKERITGATSRGVIEGIIKSLKGL